MYNNDRREEAIDLLREGRVNYWIKCRNNGVDIIAQDINLEGKALVNADRKKPSEEALAQFA
jgi:hypothetical protein